MTMLVERYLGAALEHVSSSQRDDTEREIRAAIDEMVELRVAEGESETDATEHALNELGDPRELAASYTVDRPRHLIGPGWYPRYIALLRQLLTILLPVIAVVSLLAAIGVDDKNVADAIGDAVGSVSMAIIQVGFWVTLGFAIAERVAGPGGPQAGEKRWTVADLPDEPRSRQIRIGDVAPDVIAMAVVAVLAIVTFTDGVGFLVRGVAESIDGIPLINPDLGAGWVGGFFALVAISILAPIARYLRGFWTRPMFLLEVASSALWIIYIVALASSAAIVNPEFVERVDAGSTSGEAGGTANIMVAVVVIAISLQTAWEAWTRHREYLRRYRGIEEAVAEEHRWGV